MQILTFDSPAANLANAGGKGVNLARLSQAGFNVPPGFVIPTAAYRAFVLHNNLEEPFRTRLQALDGADPAALEAASQAIRAAFSAGALPDELRQTILGGYDQLQSTLGAAQPPVAVRSSATTEDLPDLSFAGQQDTFLNVLGPQQLIQAVVNCWSSLWTARAIGYRIRNHIDHYSAALAVVVQVMVASEQSGVLFTANPLSGRLSETAIDATFGLGEALVSGQVEPDHYLVDVRANRLVEQVRGAKGVATRSLPGGGVETAAQSAETRLALSEEQALALAGLGQKIQAEVGAPQDIEWAIAGGQIYVLQSRAITSLYPVPRVCYDPLVVWFSFGAVQGLVGPITPIGADAIRHVVAAGGRIFNQTLDAYQMEVLALAGERIWIKISDLLRSPIGARIYADVLPMVEPSVGQILVQLAGEADMRVGKGRLTFKTVRSLAYFGIPVLLRLAWNMLNPAPARARFDAAVDGYLASAQLALSGDRFHQMQQVVAFLDRYVNQTIAFLLPKFVPVLGPAMASLVALRKLSGGQDSLVFEITRSVPGNVTTDMDLALWATATAIRADVDAEAHFNQTSASDLSRQFQHGQLPPAAQTAIAAFMTRYGMRGVGEIDFGQPRWREDPTPVMHNLKSYLQIAPGMGPDVLYERGVQSAQHAIEQLAQQARRQRGGWLKARLVRAFARRIRMLIGARESPKFLIIRIMGIARAALLTVGAQYAAAGTIERAEDLSFLTIPELSELAQSSPAAATDWKSLIAARQANHQRETRRRQAPRVLVSDGRAFYQGVGAQSDTDDGLVGSPVSPGVVEGRVRVVFDPRAAQLEPGDILVCPGTDPAWTPLFMTAGGLVTEVGGMMTHGSVVAREVGIPAVVGVHQATLRLKDGQRVRLDGASGKIQLLD